ncbi:MAG TPA: rhamnan synthesis F family protein, partial [Ensifer sp.]|nr:rhamnan synthesis F family protein [Ensifer sp.]
MHQQEWVAAAPGKYYLDIRASSPGALRLQLHGKQGIENFLYFSKEGKAVFLLRNPFGGLRLTIASDQPFTARLLSRRRDRTWGYKVREIVSGLGFGQDAAQADIQTKDGATLTRLLPKSAGRDWLEKGFTAFIRAADTRPEAALAAAEAALSDGAFAFTKTPVAALARAYGAPEGAEFILLLDGRRIAPDERLNCAAWLLEHYGHPQSQEGPAYDILRTNPAIGAITSGQATPPRFERWHPGNRTEKFLSAIGLSQGQLRQTGGLPPIALVRRAALNGLKALNLTEADLESGLVSAELLEDALIPMIERAGRLVAEKRLGRSPLLDWRPVEAAAYHEHRRLPPVAEENVCLFVGLLDAQGRFKPHAVDYMRAIRAQGFLVLALGVATADSRDAEDPGPEAADGFATRENAGYDFALWAAALKKNPDLWLAKSLLFANDSVYVAGDRLAGVFERLNEAKCDVTGLTPCWIEAYHLQSYFLHFKRSALAAPAAKEFWDSVVSWADKFRIISAYEVGMTQRLIAAGLACDSLFHPMAGRGLSRLNPSIHL